MTKSKAKVAKKAEPGAETKTGWFRRKVAELREEIETLPDDRQGLIAVELGREEREKTQ